MFSFLVKRLFQALIVMFVISLVAFAIQDNLGDPLRELVGQSVSEAERQALRDELVPERSLYHKVHSLCEQCATR